MSIDTNVPNKGTMERNWNQYMRQCNFCENYTTFYSKMNYKTVLDSKKWKKAQVCDECQEKDNMIIEKSPPEEYKEGKFIR